MEQFLSLKVEFIFWMGVGGGMELLLVVMPLLQYTKKYRVTILSLSAFDQLFLCRGTRYNIHYNFVK
jgi:hypothetical protein